MKKEIRITDAKRGIVQVTIADERWYMKEGTNKETGLPEFKAVPSVTWIAGHYPKGIGFYKWLADKGWDEAEALKHAAGNKGSKVHEAISAILRGEEVRIDSKFINKGTGREEELTLEEVDCIKSFTDWRATLKEFVPVVWDYTIFSERHGFAGTIDLVARVNGEVWLIDFKTSQEVWSEYELQVSAYKSGLADERSFSEKLAPKLAILQLGYKRNRDGWKWNELEDKFDLFLASKAIWKNECEGQAPKVRDYPIVLSAGMPKGAFEVAEATERVAVMLPLPITTKDNGKGQRSSKGAKALS